MRLLHSLSGPVTVLGAVANPASLLSLRPQFLGAPSPAVSHPLVYKRNMNICIMSYSLPGTFPSITSYTSPSSLHAFPNHHYPHFTDVLRPQERRGWRSLGLGGVPGGSCSLYRSLGTSAL